MKRYSVNWESLSSGTPKNELERLQYYCDGISDPSLAIEIGSYQGASAALLAEYFPTVICIDPWGHEEPLSSEERIASFVHSPGTNEYFPIYMANMERLGLWNERVIPIVGTSKALSKLPYLGADLCFVDDGHVLSCCRADIKECLRHLKPNGTLVCHDYKRGEFEVDPYIGVAQAVDEAIEIYDLEIMDHFAGICALVRKNIGTIDG